MAKKQKGSRAKGSRVKEILSTSQSAEIEIKTLWHSILEKPWHYGIGLAVIVLALLFSIGYQQHTAKAKRDLYTRYARALEAGEPAEQARQLEAAAAKGSASPEVLYMLGETALKAGEYDKATAAFERLRQEFSGDKHVPDAVEAIGFIAQENEDYDGALKAYTEIVEKWPQSFAARRQPLNIARVREAQGELADAVQAYEDQTYQFPGSSVAQESEAALARLRDSHPDLFAQETPKTPPETPAAPASDETPAAASDEAAAAPEPAPDADTQ